MNSADFLSIGQVSERTALSVSAIRFYEEQNLISAMRNGAGHRKFRRSVLRRLSFIKICQTLGYSLQEISLQLEKLPSGAAPSEGDWQRLASSFVEDIDSRIHGLQLLREKLDSCIGCGCLSLSACELYNATDKASSLGPGPRYLIGDSPSDLG